MVSYSETAKKIGREVIPLACHCQLFIQYHNSPWPECYGDGF